MKTAFLASIAALFLATGIAHAIEYQGKLPKPVQQLPSYPPVVCIAPNWAAEPCEDRQPRYWLLLLSDALKSIELLSSSGFGMTILVRDQPRPWNGKWPDETRADDDDDEGGFPNEVRGLWCLSLSESTQATIILNPINSCEQDGGVVLISYSQHYGPNGRDCSLDTITKIAPAKEISGGRSSAVYHVYLKCWSENMPGWTNFTIHHNVFDDGDEELVIKPSTQTGTIHAGTVVLQFEKGGLMDDYADRWRAVAAANVNVEIRRRCVSACTQIMEFIPKEKICFDKHGTLEFHMARTKTGQPLPDWTELWWSHQPENIRMWLREKGWVQKATIDNFWILTAEDLWVMGYRKCESNGWPQ
jgi:hypothetical protein